MMDQCFPQLLRPAWHYAVHRIYVNEEKGINRFCHGIIISCNFKLMNRKNHFETCKFEKTKNKPFTKKILNAHFLSDTFNSCKNYTMIIHSAALSLTSAIGEGDLSDLQNEHIRHHKMVMCFISFEHTIKFVPISYTCIQSNCRK